MITKILYLSPTRNKHAGGERHLVNLAEAVQQSGFEVTIGCVQGSGLEKALRSTHIKVRLIGSLTSGSSIGSIRKVCKEERPDIVHSIGYATMDKGRIGARLGGAKIIISTIQYEPDQITKYKKNIIWKLDQLINNLIDKYSARYARKIVAVSDSIGKKLISYGYPKDKIAVIPNSLSPEFTERLAKNGKDLPLPDGPLIGLISRLEEVKGVQYFLDALKVLSEQNINYFAFVIGDGPLRKDLEEQAKKNRLNDQINFTGWLDVADSIAMLSRMDIFVVPSLSEGLNTTLLEALYLSRPVVATDVGGNPEIVKNGKTGLIVPPKDPDAIADAITTLLDDDLSSEQMADAGRKLVLEKYTMDQMIGRNLILYKELLDSKGGKREQRAESRKQRLAKTRNRVRSKE